MFPVSRWASMCLVAAIVMQSTLCAHVRVNMSGATADRRLRAFTGLAVFANLWRKRTNETVRLDDDPGSFDFASVRDIGVGFWAHTDADRYGIGRATKTDDWWENTRKNARRPQRFRTRDNNSPPVGRTLFATPTRVRPTTDGRRTSNRVRCSNAVANGLAIKT